MMSWGKQTAPLSTIEQARRTSEIYNILRLHYPDKAHDPVCSPTLRASAEEEAKSGSAGCHVSWSPLLAPPPRTHSCNEQTPSTPARTIHSLPVNSIHTDTIATTSSTKCTPDDLSADQDWVAQRPGSSSNWSSAQWADWTGRWDGWRIYGPSDTDFSTHFTAFPSSQLLLPPPLLLLPPPRSKVRP